MIATFLQSNATKLTELIAQYSKTYRVYNSIKKIRKKVINWGSSRPHLLIFSLRLQNGAQLKLYESNKSKDR